MSFNIEELNKIRKATSNSKRKKNDLAEYIENFISKVDELDYTEDAIRKKGLMELMNEESILRKSALSKGARSYSNIDWAGPSACETYTHILLGENPDEIKQANTIIDELINSNRPSESSKPNFLGYLVLLVGSPLTFYFLNWWTGLIVIFLGLVIIGWKNRYD